MRTYYQYTVELNLDDPVFEKYDLKNNFNAQSVEIISEHFNDYKTGVDDCHQMLNHFMEYIEEISGTELVIAWEANPTRIESAAHITPKNEWEDDEIIHIFIFRKDEKIVTKTVKPLAIGIVFIAQYPEEMIPLVN
jgi:hypothetical protein